MYHSIRSFESDWRNEGCFTLQVFQNVPNDVKFVKIHKDVRALDRLAWHIILSMPEISLEAGLMSNKENLLKRLRIPSDFDEIIHIYMVYNSIVLNRVKSRWTDFSLNDRINVYGVGCTKGAALAKLIAHQIHHRAQMTIIMRILGLTVPSTYGPAKEEWLSMGLPAMI